MPVKLKKYRDGKVISEQIYSSQEVAEREQARHLKFHDGRLPGDRGIKSTISKIK